MSFENVLDNIFIVPIRNVCLVSYLGLHWQNDETALGMNGATALPQFENWQERALISEPIKTSLSQTAFFLP